MSHPPYPIQPPTDSSPDPCSGDLHQTIVDALKTVYDPEIPVDIYELGLIYALDIDEESHVQIVMTLTSPMCPVAEQLPVEVEQKVRAIPGVAHVDVMLTWEPPWDPSRMSEAAKLELGFF